MRSVWGRHGNGKGMMDDSLMVGDDDGTAKDCHDKWNSVREGSSNVGNDYGNSQQLTGIMDYQTGGNRYVLILIINVSRAIFL